MILSPPFSAPTYNSSIASSTISRMKDLKTPPPLLIIASNPPRSKDDAPPWEDYFQTLFKRWAEKINTNAGVIDPSQTNAPTSGSRPTKPPLNLENSTIDITTTTSAITETQIQNETETRKEENDASLFEDTSVIVSEMAKEDQSRFECRQRDDIEKKASSLSINDALYSLEYDSDTPLVQDFIDVLRNCRRKKILPYTERAFLQLCRSGLDCHIALGNNIVAAFIECDDMHFALQVFNKLDTRTEFSWTYVIRGHIERDNASLAFSLLWKMEEDRVLPSKFTFVAVLKACAILKCVVKSCEVHLWIVKLGLESDYFIGNTLVDLYAKCGSILEAQKVFVKLPARDTVSWTALICGYVGNGLHKEALRCYKKMKGDGILPDAFTCVCGLKACGSIGAKGMGKEIHCQITIEGFEEEDPFIGNALVDMYVKCGLLDEAQNVFDDLSIQDVVSWTALIAGYAEQGENEKAMMCHRQMQEQCLLPNDVTFASTLKACGNKADQENGTRLHAQVLAMAHLGSLDVITATALIDMYAKCGNMVSAQEVFDSMQQRDIAGWNALFTGYTRQGESKLVLEIFDKMINEGIKPDDVTFLSILSACSHAGSVEKGRLYFDALGKEYGIEPTIKHYNCMVDLFGRAGQIKEALSMLRSMPFSPDLVVWTTLLASCRKWGNVEIGRQAFEAALRLDDKHMAAYNAMFNLYVDANMWEEAKQIESRKLNIQVGKGLG